MPPAEDIHRAAKGAARQGAESTTYCTCPAQTKTRTHTRTDSENLVGGLSPPKVWVGFPQCSAGGQRNIPVLPDSCRMLILSRLLRCTVTCRSGFLILPFPPFSTFSNPNPTAPTLHKLRPAPVRHFFFLKKLHPP